MRSPSAKGAAALAALCLALVGAAAAAAQTLEVQSLLDLDNDPATGCTVTTADGPFDGVDELLTASADTGTGQVTALVRQSCTDPASDTFGPPVAVDTPFAPPWPVGLGLGVGGGDVVEAYLPLSLVTPGTAIRVGFTSNDLAGGEDALLGSLLIPLSVLAIPTLSEWGLLLLVLLLLASALWLLRRRRAPGAALLVLILLATAVGVAWAALMPDGDPSDWAGIPQLGSDPSGDAPPGVDIIAAFGAVESNVLFLRVDLLPVVNTPPTAQDDAFTTDEDTPLMGDVLADNGSGPDSDPDSDPLSVNTTPVSGPANGILTLAANGTFTYTPNADFNGADSFEYELLDGRGGSDVGLVSITVNPVDDPPTAVDDTATVTEDDAATTIDVLANDNDPDGDPFTIASVTQPANGTVVNNTTDLTYQPDPDYCNDGVPTDDFTYSLTPGGSTATVRVTVACVNDPPATVADTYTAVGNTQLAVGGASATAPAFTTDATNVLGNDSDPESDPLSVVAASGVSTKGGSFAIATDGSFTYTPPAGVTAAAADPDTFPYTVTDGTTMVPGTVSVIVEEMVWYVDNQAGATGDGTSSDPFDELQDAQAPASGAGETVFVFLGDGTTAK